MYYKLSGIVLDYVHYYLAKVVSVSYNVNYYPYYYSHITLVSLDRCRWTFRSLPQARHHDIAHLRVDGVPVPWASDSMQVCAGVYKAKEEAYF
jgi:hypothetical protein